MTSTITLTPTQRALVGMSRRVEDPSLIRLSYALLLTGPLDKAALGTAITALTARHPELRLAPWSPNGRVEVRPSVQPALTWEEPAAGDWPVRAAERSRQLARRPFDREAETPLRAAVIPVGVVRHVLLLCVDHAAADGWGLDLAAREISELYASSIEARAPRLHPPPSLMLAEEDAMWLSSGAAADARSWWRTKLAALPAAAFAADPVPPPGGVRTLARSVTGVPEDVSRAAERVAREWRVPLYPLLVAVSAAVVGDFLAAGTIVTGVTAANRVSPAAARSLSARYNTLPVALDTEGSLDALTHRAHVSLLDAYDRQQLPFAEIGALAQALHRLAPGCVPGVSILYDRYPLAALRLVGIEAEPLMGVDDAGLPAPRSSPHLSHAHVVVFWRQGGGGLTLTVFTDSARHGAEASARIAASIVAALAAALEHPGEAIARGAEAEHPVADPPGPDAAEAPRLTPCGRLFPVEALSPVPWPADDEART